MCLLVSLIACFIVGIASYYDILGELDDNSRNLFDQQVSNRSHDLQTSMVSKWSNLDVEIDRINAHFHSQPALQTIQSLVRQ